MLVFADKSPNLYELSRDHYEKLLHDNFTQIHTRKRATKQKEENWQRNLLNLSALMRERNVIPTKVHSLH